MGVDNDYNFFTENLEKYFINILLYIVLRGYKHPVLLIHNKIQTL